LRCVGNVDIIYNANNAVELGYNVTKGTEYFVLINECRCNRGL